MWSERQSDGHVWISTSLQFRSVDSPIGETRTRHYAQTDGRRWPEGTLQDARRRKLAIVGTWLQGLATNGRVGCDAWGHVVAIVERLENGVDPAELQAMSEAMSNVPTSSP